MSDTFGPTSGTQFAFYDHVSHSWKMWPGTGLWGSIEFSETWPKTGYMSDGRAYELPISAPHTIENDSSSWLPTPRAADPKASMGSPGAARHVESGNGSLSEVIGVHLPTPTVDFLPTPTASDTKGAAQRPGRTRGGRIRPDSDERLAGAIERFLPTPRTTDANGAGKHGKGGMDLRTAISESTGDNTALWFDVGSGELVPLPHQPN